MGAFSLKGSLLWAAFLILVSGFFYFIEIDERKELKASYILLTILPLIALYLLNALHIPINVLIGVKIAAVLCFGAVYWALLGLINYIFEKREFIYTLLNTFVFVLLFASSLSYMAPYSLGIVGIALGIAVFMVFNEIFTFFRVSQPGFSLIRDKRMLVSSFVMALLAFEISWFVVILPLGIINSAVLMTLFFVLGRDVALAHFKGGLNLPFLLRQFTFLVLLTIIIFAASNWSI